MGDVVRAVVQFLSAVASSLSKHVGVGKSSASRGNMDGCSTSKVKAPHLEDPTGGVPGPACDGVVDDGGPDEHVDDTWKHSATFGNSSNSQCDTKSG